MKLIKDETQPLECHGCGLHVTCNLIQMDYLCQHFLILCDACLKKLKEILKDE